MNYRWPAEWERHDATWIAWPHNREHWPGKFEPIPKIYVEITRALVSSETVHLCVNDAKVEARVREWLSTAGVSLDRVIFHHFPTNASWSRDHGPIFVHGPQGLTVLDWRYNANGEKWGPCDLDDVIPPQVASALGLPLIQPPMILEGGSVEGNGLGTVLTTESCLLNKNRNPQMSRQEIEAALRQYLGATNMLWLKEGISGDDTDGHIDDLARFVNPTTVVCPLTDDQADEDYAVLRRNYDDLQTMRDQDGRPLTVVPLPVPSPVVYEDTRLPASYANFYIANTAVLLPTFRCPQDAKAREVLQQYFSDRRVIGIDCTDLVWGFGTIHCSTQQQPMVAPGNGQ